MLQLRKSPPPSFFAFFFFCTNLLSSPQKAYQRYTDSINMRFHVVDIMSDHLQHGLFVPLFILFLLLLLLLLLSALTVVL